MSDIVIHIENLSKRYRIGRVPDRVGGKSLLRRVRAPFQYLVSTLREPAPDEIIWALRDVCFHVERGEVVGVIGRNGAGKTTLLKVLSRITEPTEGRAIINGRVGSLLEVGTGFHPELTGRENIYLSGAILGMKKADIDRKFDEIVSFAGVERFIDTPIKRYSSGMYVRLAFAVAAHLEPEILLIDEVLAVGDVEFQKRCLGKMGDVAREGRTVLFVSHNMAAVLDLCPTAYWLDQGMIRDCGEASRVIQNYLKTGLVRDEMDLVDHPGRRAGARQVMRAVRLSSNGVSTGTFKTNGCFELAVECTACPKVLPQMSLGVMLKDGIGSNIFGTSMSQHKQSISNYQGHYIFRFTIDQLPLSPGTYGVSLFLGNGSYDIDTIENAVYFDVLWDKDVGLAFPPQPYWGALHVPVQWEVEAPPEPQLCLSDRSDPRRD